MTSRSDGPSARIARPPRRRGQALIEFALILPILLTVVFAIMDFGYYMFVTISVNHATRAGVRKAAMNNATRQQIKDVVRNTAVGVVLNDSQIDVATAPADDSLPGRPPTVALTVQFDHQLLVSNFFHFHSIRVNSSFKSMVTTYDGKSTITF